MSGKYENSPLTYVSAQIKTTSIPNLTENQMATLQQRMVDIGFPSIGLSEGKEFAIRQDSNDHKVKNVYRHAFFNKSKSRCVVLNPESIELRMTSYTRFLDMCEEVQRIIDVLVSSVEAFARILVNELVLSYVDVVVPLHGRELADYFDKKSSALPLSILYNESRDLHCSGSVQMSRVVEKDKRVSVSLEQLPVLGEGKRPTKYIPNQLTEPDPKLGMPLLIRDEWQGINSKYYALILTEAACLVDFELGSLNYCDSSKTIHDLTKQIFNQLINKDVCDQDWNFISDNDTQGE